MAARESGRSVIVKEAMANGRLTPRNADPAFAHKLRLLCDTAQQVNVQLVSNWFETNTGRGGVAVLPLDP